MQLWKVSKREGIQSNTYKSNQNKTNRKAEIDTNKIANHAGPEGERK